VAGPRFNGGETVQFDVLNGITGGEYAGVHGFNFRREIRNYFAYGAADVFGGGEAVAGGEHVVDADVTQFAIDKAEADGSGVIDGIEFGQVLGGEGFAFLNGSFGADFVGDVAGEAADDGGVDAGGS
jgi:hypothetical protein